MTAADRYSGLSRAPVQPDAAGVAAGRAAGGRGPAGGGGEAAAAAGGRGAVAVPRSHGGGPTQAGAARLKKRGHRLCVRRRIRWLEVPWGRVCVFPYWI